MRPFANGWRPFLAVVGSILAAAPAAVAADAWPSRPIRMIVPYAPGGATDATGRAYADKMSGLLGQQVVVDNRAGASGMIGIEACGKAAGDGYTTCVVPLATVTVLPHVRKTAYDPFRDFVPVGKMSDAIFAFAIGNGTPARTMQEFIAYAKQRPGKLTMASSGIATVTHLSGAAMQLAAGLEMTHVPYKGGAEQLQDLLAGNVTMMFEGNPFPHHKAGKLKVLAVSTPYRHPLFPDVPSIMDILPGFAVPNWFALYAPGGTPRPVVDKLGATLNTVADMPDVQERLLAMGVRAAKDTPEGAAAELKRQYQALGELVKKLDIKVDGS